MHWHMWWPMGGMGLFWLAVIAVGFLVLYYALGRVTRTGARTETPKETLQKRFARGEISRDEYRRALEDLKQP